MAFRSPLPRSRYSHKYDSHRYDSKWNRWDSKRGYRRSK